MESQAKLKELTRCAMFTALALTIFIIEARLPAPLPFAGAKLGLSNGVTLYVVYRMGVSQGGKVLFCRILLGAMFSGQFLTLCYSAVGGVASFLFLALVKKYTAPQQLWFLSPCSAMVHNIAQVFLATKLLGTTAVFYFLPYLLLLSVASGLFVGIVAQTLLSRENIP